MTSCILEFNSSALMSADGFEFISRKIMNSKRSLAAVRIFHNPSGFELVPHDTFGSLETLKVLIESWIQEYLNEWQRTRRVEPMRAIRQLVGKLSLYATQSPESRVLPVYKTLDEIAVRILALKTDLNPVHIQERIQRTSSGSYDSLASQRACTRTADGMKEVVYGQLLSLGPQRNAHGMHMGDAVLSSLLQYHLRADTLICWPDTEKELGRSRSSGIDPTPAAEHTLLDACRARKKLMAFQKRLL